MSAQLAGFYHPAPPSTVPPWRDALLWSLADALEARSSLPWMMEHCPTGDANAVLDAAWKASGDPLAMVRVAAALDVGTPYARPRVQRSRDSYFRQGDGSYRVASDEQWSVNFGGTSDTCYLMIPRAGDERARTWTHCHYSGGQTTTLATLVRRARRTWKAPTVERIVDVCRG